MPTEPALLVQVFAYHFPPSSASGAARPGRWARYLPRHGVRCRVAAHWTPEAATSGQAAYLRPEDAPGGWRPMVPVARLLQRIAPYNEQLPWLPAALGHSFRVNRAEAAQAVLSSFPPLAAHLAGLLFHLRFGVPWIADFRDPLAGNPFRDRAWARPYDRALESLIFHRAAAVLVTNDAVAERYRARHAPSASKIRVLWNGFDPQEPAVAPCPAVAPRRLVHAGSLYGPRRPGSLIRAVALLLESGRLAPGAWRLEFIGPHEADSFSDCGAALERLRGEGMIEILGGQRPRRELEQAMAAASILALFDLTGEERSVQVPAKLFDYVRCGLPVAAWSPPGSPAREVLARAGVPALVFSPGDADAEVAEKLMAWLDSPPAQAPASAWFLETFDGARQAALLAELIRKLTAGGRAS